MNRILIALISSLAAMPAFAATALGELNRADGSITSSDGRFLGRDFKLIDGFKVELLYVSNIPTEGQWVAIGWDNKKRLVVPAYQGAGRIVRFTIPKVGNDVPVQAEVINSTPAVPINASEGILYAFNSLYYNANRGGQAGVFRMTDTNGDDKFDQTRVIRTRAANGDHGTHTLQLTPDGKMISVISGNATRMTEHNRSRVPEIWGEDNLVMRMDLSPPGFHRAPEAHILNFNEDGSDFELWSMGMRNPVSHAYNKDGELFVYDADEEPNMGFTVAYRPTPIIHSISGSDAGWRSGSKVHPFHRFDFFGPIGVVGSGSPVGSGFGTGTKFPAKYQDAFFVADWSFGYLWAVTLTPEGSSYKATALPFLSGSPFPVSGVIANPEDGSLLVTTTGSQLYRITYVGNEDTTATKPDQRFKAMRDQRHDIEKFHGTKNNAAVAAVWPFLSDEDRGIRYAARTALEWQDPVQWTNKALTEQDPRKAIAAIASLARVSSRDEYHTAPGAAPKDKALEARMLAALNKIDFNHLNYQEKLDLLRAYQLTMIRLGRPSDSDVETLIARLDPMLPSPHQELNRELSEILVYLQAPSAASKVLALLRNAPDNPYYGIQEWINPQQRQRQDRGNVTGPNLGLMQASLAKQDAQLFYAQLLRTLTKGWTSELRTDYLTYFSTEPRNYYGSTTGLANIRADAISQIPADEKPALQALIDTPMPAGRGRGGRGAAAAPVAGAAAPGAAAPAGAAPGAAPALLPAAPGGAAPAPAVAGAAPAVAPAGGGGGRGGGGTPGLALPAVNLYIGTGGRGGLTDTETTTVIRFNESMTKEIAAQAAANTALLTAVYATPSSPATIQARINDLAAAELALANAKATAFARFKTTLKSPPTEAIVNALKGVGGGGGGGRGGGAAAAPAVVPAAAPAANPAAAPAAGGRGRGN